MVYTRALNVMIVMQAIFDTIKSYTTIIAIYSGSFQGSKNHVVISLVVRKTENCFSLPYHSRIKTVNDFQTQVGAKVQTIPLVYRRSRKIMVGLAFTCFFYLAILHFK